jgi:hypothetical protein
MKQLQFEQDKEVEHYQPPHLVHQLILLPHNLFPQAKIENVKKIQEIQEIVEVELTKPDLPLR